MADLAHIRQGASAAKNRVGDVHEEWRPVIGFAGYEVSDHGRVRSVDRHVPWRSGGVVHSAFWRGRVLRDHIAANGYPCVHLAKAVRTVHSLVADAFLGPRPPDMQVAHADGDRSNPRLSNLRYATQAENEMDKLRHGTFRHGERAPNARLTARQVSEIRALKGTATQREIAARFGVKQPTINAIFSGRSWGRS